MVPIQLGITTFSPYAAAGSHAAGFSCPHLTMSPDQNPSSWRRPRNKASVRLIPKSRAPFSIVCIEVACWRSFREKAAFAAVAPKKIRLEPFGTRIVLFVLRHLEVSVYFLVFQISASVAQLAEQRFCKPPVVGSNPSAGSLTGSVAEDNLPLANAKGGVARRKFEVWESWGDTEAVKRDRL